ncbi:MAG TPA: S1 family peptidase [Sandaracinaceae bacterium LLY-WYZ-13_1]|nr:S1 family peptidase [Sandaracinaceae bacterium LLY-WYZ-13_1]
MTRQRLCVLLAGALLGAAAGCAAPTDPGGVGVHEASIVGGEPGGDPAVVVLQNYRSGGLCTGALIAPRVVLTAKHCVQQPFADGPVAPSDIVVGIGDSARRTTSVLRVESITATPGSYSQDSRGGVGRDLVGVDVAVMVLQSGEASVEPLSIMRESHTSLSGQQITAVGFGQTPSGEVGVKYTATGWITGTDASLIYVGALTCQGDSGGPAITEEGLVAGVVSFGAGSCGSGYGAYNAIYPFLDLIDGALMEAGSCLDDGPERCDGADNDCDDQVDETCTEIGGACGSDDECVGLTCRDTVGGRICTSPCDPLRPEFGCEPGFFCAFSEGCEGYCVPRETEGTLPVGAECTDHAECSTSFCTDPGDGRRRCLTACEGDRGMCLAGEACAAGPGACGGCVDAEILDADRGLGEPCDEATDCRSGDCFADGGRSYCTRACEGDTDCPDTFHCRGMVCVAGPRGDIGDPCLGNGDCAEGTFCAMQGERAWCTRLCTDEECPDRFECVAAGGTEVCAPDRGLLGDVCASDEDCVTGVCEREAGATSGVCSRMCGPDAPCAVGFECRRTEDGLGAICAAPAVEEASDGGCAAAAPGRGGSSRPGWAWVGMVAWLAAIVVWRRRRQ